MDAGPLQTYTVEHALCGSAKRGRLEGEGTHPASLPRLPSILSAALSPIMPLSLHTFFFFSPPQLRPLFISPTLTERLSKSKAAEVCCGQY